MAGGTRNEHAIQKETFLKTEIPVSKGDTLYMSSDGIMDMGNTQRKRYSRTHFIQLINSIHPLPMKRQAAEIEKAIEQHTQGTELRDDISVLGIRL